nr:U3 small nucleolar ribonucleoprotein IMP4 [Seculamonas ecuadoriensis]
MIRRNARLRREYLYKKNHEIQDATKAEKKRKIKEAIAAGRPIPTELRAEAPDLRHEIALEDAGTAQVSTHVDDEYARAGIEDPRVLLTTSRDPSPRLQQFAKELKLIFPNCQRMNRGHYIVKDIVQACRKNEFTDLVIVHEHRGVPDGLIVSHLPYGPTAYFAVVNTVMRHDIDAEGTIPQAYPHLIFENFTTKLGSRIKNVLQYLFPVPKAESKRVITFSNSNDFISFRHHVFEETDGQVTIKEIGPRFELRLFQLKLGTVEMKEAENEWVLRPYMNTAHKKTQL